MGYAAAAAVSRRLTNSRNVVTYSRRESIRILFALIGGILVFLSRPNVPPLGADLGHNTQDDDDNDSAENVNKVRATRQRYSRKCHHHGFLQSTLDQWYVPPTKIAASSNSRRPPIKPCKFTFLDFGANVGDSMGKFINAGVPLCNSTARYNLGSGRLELDDDKAHSNSLTKWVQANMKEASKQVGVSLQPENYCYYGIEGNPVFTTQLQQLETQVLYSKPRPLQSAHFFTETIGAGVNGPSTLYLDTVNAKQNYWGSSVYSAHPDVQASSSALKFDEVTPQPPHDDNTGTAKAAAVTAVTLTSLIRQTLTPEPGNHLLIKMDIEGSEYAVLTEAFDSGVLCDYAAQAVRIDMLVEMHSKTMLGEQDVDLFERWNNKVRRQLVQCGVNMKIGRNAGR